jgi:tripeptide aminopeptidase
MKPIAERFMRYVKIDTQSDPHSSTFPSTEKQKDLSRVLVQELLDMGISDAHLDEFGYVYGTITSNSVKNIPVVCFCAHVDTAPDCSGTNVKPILHENFQGNDIVLPDDTSQIISISNHPYLKQKIGDDIITASGLTLLGADDKSGVAIIMELASYLQKNHHIKHGAIKILFTPDEEVGKGVDNVDIMKLGADVAYTLDGGELGALESENFSADGVLITINGVSAHPGYGKDKLVNAIKIAGEFLDALPKSSMSPETTEGKDGFFHPVEISGNAEKTTIHFIVRDFSEELLHQHEAHLKEILVKIMSKHSKAFYAFEVKEQYRNMKEVLDLHPKIIELAANAIKESGLPLHSIPVRGGTDGSRLSFMGLPCPNIFTGEMAFHSKQEYVSVQDMEKAVDVLVALVQLWEKSV